MERRCTSGGVAGGGQRNRVGAGACGGSQRGTQIQQAQGGATNRNSKPHPATSRPQHHQLLTFAQPTHSPKRIAATSATPKHTNHTAQYHQSHSRSGERAQTPQGDTHKAAAAAEPDEEDDDLLQWDGHFSYMLISTGGADRPDTFPPELPIHVDAEMHLRSLPHGAWAGITLPWGSRRGPEYSSKVRGYCRRIKVRRTRGSRDPAGYMGTSTAFVLFPWGKIQGGRPRKWLLHITGGPPTPDPDATQLQPGSSFSLEMPPGAVTWQLGRLQPRLALQYYYDWGHMMGTGAIYDRLPRASNNPPMAWEQMALQLIPPPGRQREMAPNPTFDEGEQGEPPTPGAAPSTSPGPAPQPRSPSPTAATKEGANATQWGEAEEEQDGQALMQQATQLCKFASAFMSEYRSFPTGLERLASQVKRLIAFY